jgi:hypothetical protein
MKRALVLILTVFLCSCDSGVEWKDHPYEVIWIDTSNNRTLNYEISETHQSGESKLKLLLSVVMNNMSLQSRNL